MNYTKEFSDMLTELLNGSRRDKEDTKEKHDALTKVVKSAANLKKDLERLENVIAAQGREE